MDSNKPDFKKLWASQTVAAPDLKVIREQVTTLRKKVMKRMIVTNVMLLLTSAFIIYIWIHFQPEYLSTKLGIIVIIAAMAIFLIMLNIMSARFTAGEDQRSADYLNKLLQLKKRQRFMHTTMTNLYFALLSTGISLYMFEYTRRMSVVGGLTTYGVTAAWILFNWFYFRPRQIRKQQGQLDRTIEKVASVIRQMDEVKS